MIQILLAEDDQYLSRVYQRFFSRRKYSFKIVPCCDECIEKTKKVKPKLILIDIMVNPEVGLEVLKKLKGTPETKMVPVAVLIDSEKDECVKDAFRYGADDYIGRLEFECSEITNKINKYLHS